MTSPRVIVGLAGASEGPPALWWAVAEAAHADKPLVIGYGCPTDSALAEPGVGVRKALLELVDPPLARAVSAAQLRLGGDRVSVVVRPEPPGALLVSLARPSDLVVVGAPARPGWLERESTTHHVVRHAPCPVVVVHPSSRPGHGPSGPFRTDVVVGVDGSAAARAACGFGFAYAANHRRPLVAVHVTPHVDHDLWYDEEMHLPADPAALAMLAEEIEPWQHKYPEVAVKRAVFGGRPLPGLLRAAEGAALLVLGGTGSGRSRRLLGSIADAGVDRVYCPVAIVRDDHGASTL